MDQTSPDIIYLDTNLGCILRVDIKNNKFYVNGQETSDVERVGFALKEWLAEAHKQRTV